jgi:hypothetical protein
VGRSEKELPGDGMRFADSSMIAKLQVKAASVLTAIDEVGSWNIASCLVVLNVFVWETYSMDYLSAAVRRPAPVCRAEREREWTWWTHAVVNQRRYNNVEPSLR